MYYNETWGQWVQHSVAPPFKKGSQLIEDLLHKGLNIIPAGTIMVFEWQGRPYMLFQTLLSIVLTTSTDTTLVAFEPGSIVRTNPKDCFTPTLRLRDCRMPTEKELIRYNTIETI